MCRGDGKFNGDIWMFKAATEDTFKSTAKTVSVCSFIHSRVTSLTSPQWESRSVPGQTPRCMKQRARALQTTLGTSDDLDAALGANVTLWSSAAFLACSVSLCFFQTYVNCKLHFLGTLQSCCQTWPVENAQKIEPGHFMEFALRVWRTQQAIVRVRSHKMARWQYMQPWKRLK